MSEAPFDPAVAAFLEKVEPPVRKRDALTLLAMMERATGQPAQLYGTIVGFGTYRYEYASGRKGETAAAGFSPRKAATTVYLVDGVSAFPDELTKLGPHTTGKGCLYLRDLDQIDLKVLEKVVRTSYQKLTNGTWGKRARDGDPSD